MEEADLPGIEFSPSKIAWWVLAYLLAIGVALFSWSWCYDVFKFPEREKNFALLSKMGYIEETTAFTPLTAPPAPSASAQYLYDLFARLEDEQVKKLNKELIRSYITNYKKAPVYRYLEGEFRITSVRALSEKDFLYPGLLIKARAYITGEADDLSSPYPMEIDYYIPTNAKAAKNNFQPGDLLNIVKSKHCATLIKGKMVGAAEEPTLRCVVVPLAYNIYISPDRHEFPLSPPQKLNLSAELLSY